MLLLFLFIVMVPAGLPLFLHEVTLFFTVPFLIEVTDYDVYYLCMFLNYGSNRLSPTIRNVSYNIRGIVLGILLQSYL